MQKLKGAPTDPLRFYRTCEIEISKDLRSLDVHTDPAADPGILPLLVQGSAKAGASLQPGDRIFETFQRVPGVEHCAARAATQGQS